MYFIYFRDEVGEKFYIEFWAANSNSNGDVEREFLAQFTKFSKFDFLTHPKIENFSTSFG